MAMQVGRELDADVRKVFVKFCVSPRAGTMAGLGAGGAGAGARFMALHGGSRPWWLLVEPHTRQEERQAEGAEGSEFRQQVLQAGELLLVGVVTFCRTRGTHEGVCVCVRVGVGPLCLVSRLPSHWALFHSHMHRVRSASAA